MMMIKIEPIELHGSFYTVKQFATMTNRSPQTIYNLLKKGNSIRAMKHTKIENFVLIPRSELTEFPFTNTGRNARFSIYHYAEDGTIAEMNELEDMI